MTVDLLMVVDVIASYYCLHYHLHVLTLGHWLNALEFTSGAYSLYYTNYNAYSTLVLIHSDQLVSACTFHPFVSKLAKLLLIRKLSKPAKFLVFCSFLDLKVMPVSNKAF